MEGGSKLRIGAAMPIRSLGEHRDWLVSGQRDLEIQDPAIPAVLDADWKSLIHQARGILSGHTGRLGVHGPFIGFSLRAGFDRKLCEIVIARLRQSLEFAAELGAGYMVIHSPYVFFGASPFSIDAGPKGMFDEKATVHAVLDEIVGLAEAAKCVLVIENVQDTNTVPLLDLIRSFDSEYVRMSLDVGHAFITHKLGGPTPDQWVRDAGPLLEHMHIQDSDGQTDRHWAPGDGEVNWHALFEAIDMLEQSPRMILELRDHRAIERGATYLAGRGFIE